MINPNQIQTELPILAIINSNFGRSYFLEDGKINKKKLKQDLSVDEAFLKAFVKLKPAEFVKNEGCNLSKAVINKIEVQSSLSLLIVFCYFAKQLGFSSKFFHQKFASLGNKSMQEKCLSNEHISAIQTLYMQFALLLSQNK